jgi:hypothetical protein
VTPKGMVTGIIVMQEYDVFIFQVDFILYGAAVTRNLLKFQFLSIKQTSEYQSHCPF